MAGHPAAHRGGRAVSPHLLPARHDRHLWPGLGAAAADARLQRLPPRRVGRGALRSRGGAHRCAGAASDRTGRAAAPRTAAIGEPAAAARPWAHRRRATGERGWAARDATRPCERGDEHADAGRRAEIGGGDGGAPQAFHRWDGVRARGSARQDEARLRAGECYC
eukprot:2990103-Prymnesium_polylepis.1